MTRSHAPGAFRWLLMHEAVVNLLLIAVTVSGVWIGIAVHLAQQRQELERRAERESGNLAQAAAESIGQTIAGVDEALRFLWALYLTVAYINYNRDLLNNFSFRPEIYYDPQGQRTGHAATYYVFSLGWQHWWSPQLEARPEIGYYHSDGANAFNGGTRNYTWLLAGDLILHF